MDLARDPELIELFRREMAERVDVLIEGSSAMADDAFPAARLDELLREAHTIKGTSLVMGLAEAGQAGAVIEDLLTDIQAGRRVPSVGLGRGLIVACQALRQFIIDPGSDHRLEAGVATLTTLADDPLAADDLLGPVEDNAEQEMEEPPEIPVAEPEDAGTFIAGDLSRQFYDIPANARDDDPLRIPINIDDAAEIVDFAEIEDAVAADDRSRTLGGLLSAPEMWINSETTGVATARLYEIISRAAELRIDTESLVAAVERLADMEDADELRRMVGALRYGVRALALSTQAMQQQTIGLVAVPMSSVLATLPSLVRFLAKRTAKDVRFEIIGDESAELDRGTLDRVADIIRQLLVNSIVHGIQDAQSRGEQEKDPTGTLTLTVTPEDDHMRIVVTDDGNGIDWPAIRAKAVELGLLEANYSPSTAELETMLFNEPISTSAGNDELGGSGEGLSKVAQSVQDLHGSIDVRSVRGIGTEVEVVVPRFQSLQSIVLVLTANGRWGIPELSILDRTSMADSITYRTPEGRKEVLFRDGTIPLVSLSSLVGDDDAETSRDVIVVSTHGGPLALAVAGTLGVMEVAPKRLGGLLRSAPFVTGATMVGGEIVMLIDTDTLMEVADAVELDPPTERRTILIVDDSAGVRQVLTAALTAGGFEVVAAGSAVEALEQLANHIVDAMVVDYSMPGEDGVDLVVNVRKTYGTMPVVMVSAVAREEDRARAEAAGIDAYFEKSDFREGVLASMLKELLDNESPIRKTAQ